MSDKPKLCVDCRFQDGWQCLRNKQDTVVSLVTGQPVFIYPYDCQFERYGGFGMPGPCGEDGRFWQPKEPVS